MTKFRMNLRNTEAIIACFAVIFVCISCKKEKEDYREAWCGPYRLEVTAYQGNTPTTCGIGLTSFPVGRVYYDKSMRKDVLALKEPFLLFKLKGDTGRLVGETDDGKGNYEKGYITSSGILFYEKQTYTGSCTRTTIEGARDESILVY